MVQTVSIIGVGRVGGALALALDKCGYKVENLVSRNGQNADKTIQPILKPI
jgi:predicted dinucleotide-binding enzyme